ncbi:hypothetical protein, partial [uncultured Algibacter sp.]|uniref:hypothetical protein n=1 Tax=uncultured Algibacter sp. TaxID=298659 RepID=UPI00261C4D9D
MDTTTAAVASITGGCAPKGSIKSQDAAPALCAGGEAKVVWTITDLCETFDVEATWKLNAPAKIAVGTPPSDAMADSCTFANQGEVDAAYAKWIMDTTTAAVASITGGCTPKGSIKSQDAAPALCAGGEAKVVWTITDLCETFDVEATWKLNAPAKIAVGTPPSDAMADSCTFANQGEVDAAYAKWIMDTTTAAVAS